MRQDLYMKAQLSKEYLKTKPLTTKMGLSVIVPVIPNEMEVYRWRRLLK